MAHRKRHAHHHNVRMANVANHLRTRHREPRFPAISPFGLIQDDFQRMLLTKRLRTTDDACEWILMQSVEGHAQMGHGVFSGERFPNTEMEDIVEALGRNPRAVASQRQGVIDEVREWATRAMNGSAPRTLVNEYGDGLIGCGLLRHLEVEPADVLRGLYLGGLRDDSEVRLEVERRTGARIGGGHCRFVNIEVMHQMGLDGEKLSQAAHGEEIEGFKQAGLIVDDPGPGAWDDPKIRYMYVRDRVGGGASDDAAIVAGGLLYNLSVALGVFLADAVDTFEKFVIDYEDQDADLARHLEATFPALGLNMEDVYRLTWICHAPHELEGKVPDSSLRHLLEVDRESDQTALESHLAHACGYPFADMPLGSEDVPNVEFYQWLEARIKACPESVKG